LVLEITSRRTGSEGKPSLKIRGRKDRTLVVEMSTDMTEWVPVGVAKPSGGNEFEFDDVQSAPVGVRYYRVVSPK
jgi:hypothetical protein